MGFWRWRRLIPSIFIFYSQLTMVLNQINILPELTIRNARADEGRKQYEILLSDSKLPRYGSCWKTALDTLHSACNQLTEDTQSRMSLAFINCFLKQSGKRTFPCSPDQDLATCLNKMDSLSFQIYANYLPHTQNMCFFILSQVWTEEIGTSVSTLMSASSEMQDRLDVSLATQDKILEVQQKSLINEDKMLRVTSDLISSIETSKSNVVELLGEFKESTMEQKMVIGEIFDRFLKFQSMFFGEVSGFFSVFYHVVSVLLSYVLTTPTRCANARFWLFLIATGNLMMERCLADWGLEEYKLNPESMKVLLHQRIWVCRTVSCILGVVVWIVSALRYKDYNYANYCILECIQRENKELKSLIMSSSFSSRNVSTTSGANPMIQYRTFPSIESAHNFSSEDEDPDFTLSGSDISGYETESSYTTAPQSNGSSPAFQKTANKPKKTKRQRENAFTSSPQTRYNLRQRTPSVNFNATLITETPEMFAQIVQQLEKATKHTSTRTRQAFFSE